MSRLLYLRLKPLLSAWPARCSSINQRLFPGRGILLLSQFSSTATQQPVSIVTLERDRLISRTLFRQLLRWCVAVKKEAFPDAILDHFIPPLRTVAPDEIDPYRMELLYEASVNADDVTNMSNDARVVRRALELLPNKTIFSRHQLIVPARTLTHVENAVRALFRLNNVDMPDSNQDEVAYSALLNYQKKRRDVAFTHLRTLNELYSDDLARVQQLRSRHVDRENVTFVWGQVVQHRQDRWRGVVVGWDKKQGRAQSDRRSTSLTTKDYGSLDESDASVPVQVTLLLDVGDAYHLATPTGWTTTTDQANLVAVTDKHLCRIRNNFADSLFSAYDSNAGRFLPKPIKAFEYPSDFTNCDASASSSRSEEARRLCEGIQHAVSAFASQLDSNWQQTAGSSATSPVWRAFQSKLQSLSTRAYQRDEELITADLSVTTEAAMSVGTLLTLSNSVFETMHQRRIAMADGHKVRFSVGDVVQHKKYGFRGVVVAWDPVPTVNVTRWDGLRDIENPMTLPFYQVVPDQQDCIDAFGGERPLRYVCEANLDPCPRDRMLLDVDLDSEWDREGDLYVAPDLLRFKYGADLEDGGTFERCMIDLEARLNEWQCQAREANDPGVDDVMSNISLQRLMQLLQFVDSQYDASAIQDTVKEMRKAHYNLHLRSRLERGLTTLVAGNTKSAREMYLELVQLDDSYAEAWNKLATCEFMMGNYKEAEVATLRALELEPMHYQAIAGLGLLHMERKQYQEAADCFRKNLDLDPWSPVAAKLSYCLDMLDAADDDVLSS